MPPAARPLVHELSDEALRLVAARFRLLGEPNRLRLLHSLQSGELSVGALVERTQMSQPNVSRHLHALTNSGILARRRHGTSVVYSIADEGVFALCLHVCESLQRRARSHSESLAWGTIRGRRPRDGGGRVV